MIRLVRGYRASPTASQGEDQSLRHNTNSCTLTVGSSVYLLMTLEEASKFSLVRPTPAKRPIAGAGAVDALMIG